MPFHRGIVASGIPGAAPSPPGTPTATTCANAESVLSWTAPADNGGSAVTDYVVQYSTSATFASSVTTFADGTTGSTGATVTGLSNGTPYYFRVAAVNAYGTSSYSGISTVITPATVPNAPTSVVGASHANGQSSVSWVAPNGAGTGGNGPPFTFTVQYSTSATFASAVTTFGTTSSSSPLIVNGLTNGTTYYFRVKATNCAGDSSYSTISAGAVPSTVPSAPATPTIYDDAPDRFDWTAPDNGGRAITGYYYKVSTDDGAYGAETFVAAGSALSYTTQNTFSTSTLKIQVRAVNDNGSSGFSNASANTGVWSQESNLQYNPTACPAPTCSACTAPTCESCGTCAACDGGCDGCGTRSVTGTKGSRTATAGTRAAPTLGTSTRTCYRWVRGNYNTGYTYGAGVTTACGGYSACTASTCGACAAGTCSDCPTSTCGCSGCSASWGGDNYVSSFVYGGETYTRFPATNSAGNGIGTWYYYISAANDINNLCGCYEHRAYNAQYCSASDSYRAIDTGGCQYYRSLNSCGGGGK